MTDAPSLTLYEAMERHFSALDTVATVTGTPFPDRDAKDQHETVLMYAFRKRRAAEYHAERVRDAALRHERDAAAILKLPPVELEFDARPDASALDGLPPDLASHIREGFSRVRVTETVSSRRVDLTEFACELSAFMSALRSSVDFLAEVPLRLMRQKGTASALLVLADGNRSSPLLDAFRPHAAWLREFRSYRDQHVHRVFARVRGGAHVVVREGVTRGGALPIVVPRSAPGRELDTREIRAMEGGLDLPPGLQFETEETRGVDAEGKPRPAYANLGLPGSKLLGDVLVETEGQRVLVEIGVVHDWTYSKWRDKLVADTSKLRRLDGLAIFRLQAILRLGSERFQADRSPWLASVPAWTATDVFVQRADLPGGAAAEVRGFIVADPA